ncbi:MAG TPA: hypothetical protein VFF65_08220 [Phycisphaerales bacterium]|nr:hypothetical protein [Phycisphaerales bacterium]
MNKIVLSGIVAAAGLAASAQAQYNMELRLIADGDAGSPNGASASTTFNIGDRNNVTATRIGFWLQARVAQTEGQNWGVTRVSSPAGGGASFIGLTDPAGASALSRGAANSGASLFGRGLGFRNGGANSGNTGNTPGSVPFPGGAGNENGGLDNGGAGALMTRIYGFDAYVGATRADTDADGDGDVDDNGDGSPEQPWRVNGGNANAAADGVPHPSDGTFAPWANVYRFYVDVTNFNSLRDIILNASALVNGAIQASPTSPGGASYAMQLSPGQLETATYTFTVVPTPGAAAMLGLGGLAAMRRRR